MQEVKGKFLHLSARFAMQWEEMLCTVAPPHRLNYSKQSSLVANREKWRSWEFALD
jgi:hypothetical protein